MYVVGSRQRLRKRKLLVETQAKSAVTRWINLTGTLPIIKSRNPLLNA